MLIKTLFIVLLLLLSAVDLTMTAIYVQRYKAWQPNKPYNMIELNPLLVFLWNNLGFTIGMIVGAIIIFTLVYLIAKMHWAFGLIMLAFLVWTIINHTKNFHLLGELITKYPLGHLPETIFGNVTGNN